MLFRSVLNTSNSLCPEKKREREKDGGGRESEREGTLYTLPEAICLHSCRTKNERKIEGVSRRVSGREREWEREISPTDPLSHSLRQTNSIFFLNLQSG